MGAPLFVTGTDTGVGKTIVSAMLMARLKGSGKRAIYFKPVQTGDDDDSATVRRLASLSEQELKAPIYSFPLPAAPNIAAREAGSSVELSRIVRAFAERATRNADAPSWIVEGAGGLLVPLTEKSTLADLVFELHIPILVVASTRLGTINHTLLTLEAARNRGIVVQGIVLTGTPSRDLKQTLEAHGDVPVLAEVAQIDGIGDFKAESFARAAHEAIPDRAMNALFQWDQRKKELACLL